MVGHANWGVPDVREWALSIVSELGGPTDPLFLAVAGIVLVLVVIAVRFLLRGR